MTLQLSFKKYTYLTIEKYTFPRNFLICFKYITALKNNNNKILVRVFINQKIISPI